MSNPVAKGKRSWSSFWGKKPDNEETSPRKWTMGILEDKETIEVPGKEAKKNDSGAAIANW
jgi:hypothetical protein